MISDSLHNSRNKGSLRGRGAEEQIESITDSILNLEKFGDMKLPMEVLNLDSSK